MQLASRKQSEQAPPRMAALATLPVFLTLEGQRAIIAGGTAAASRRDCNGVSSSERPGGSAGFATAGFSEALGTRFSEAGSTGSVDAAGALLLSAACMSSPSVAGSARVRSSTQLVTLSPVSTPKNANTTRNATYQA